MGRIMALSGLDPLPIKESLNAFYPLCEDGKIMGAMNPGHLDGWGISAFSAGRAVYCERRAESASQERPRWDAAIARAERTRTPVLMAQFRKASQGGRDIANTHPFHYRDWVFMHNGTIFNAGILSLEDAQPQGTTDSERLMLWLLEKMIPDLDPTARLVELLQEARRSLQFTSLAILLSDGKKLWVYREAGTARMEKQETLADRENYYTLYSTRRGDSTVLCSEPLSAMAKDWTPLPTKTLMVYTPGNVLPECLAV